MSRRGESPTGAKPDLCGEFVTEEADHTGRCERPEVGQVLWMDEPHDGCVEGDAGRDEDRKHDRDPRKSFATNATEVKGDSERDRRERIAEVVDDVGEQRDAERA